MCRIVQACWTGALSLVLAAFASAADLGRIGPAYPVTEANLIDFIKQRLGAMEQSGELARLQRESAARSVASIRNPKPLPGLRTGTVARTSYIDPSFTLEHDVLDQHGRVMYRAGTRKNPLEVVGMSRRLLFFDARDPRQLARANSLITQYGAAIKPVLVGGSYLELMRKWKIPVYYDQQSLLVKRFGIGQVPAMVYREGMLLRVDELETAP